MEERTVHRGRTEQRVPAPAVPLSLTPPPPEVSGDTSLVTRLADEITGESAQRERRMRRSLALADVSALAVAILVTVPLASPDNLNPVGLLLFPALVATAKILGLYDGDDQRIRKTTADELPRLAQLGALLMLGLWLGDRLLIGGPAGKMQVLGMGVVYVAAALVFRRVARGAATHGTERERCLFLGERVAYERLKTIFFRHELSSDLVGCTPVAGVLEALHAAPGREVAVMRELIARNGAHRIVIGPHGLSNAATFELLEAARMAGARVSLLPDMLEVVGSSVDFDDLYGVTLLGVRHSQLSRSSRFVKRAFDVVGASLALVVTAPLMAIVAIAIRLDSKGPILFSQMRIGRGGEPFHILKFRTMVPDAEDLKDALVELNEAEGLFKITDDPRITRVGRFLRRTSLDELPQLFNVLQGSMSLVGPRPLIADEDGRILGVRRGRLRLTPGMTGPWQISGSARIPLEDMVKLDHLYVSNWSLWEDVKILLRTVPFVFGSRGI